MRINNFKTSNAVKLFKIESTISLYIMTAWSDTYIKWIKGRFPLFIRSPNKLQLSILNVHYLSQQLVKVFIGPMETTISSVFYF